MSLLMIVFRVIHIVIGVLWVGTATFTAYFLIPAIQEAGPDGAKVMAGLQRRKMMTVVPILGVTTLLSGLWLFWRDSAGFEHLFMASAMGMGLATGGLLALAGFALGMGVMRPSLLKAGALAQTMSDISTDSARQARLAEIQALRSRGATAGRWTSILLLLAVSAMAVARYL